jgi:hypothetical protein
MKNLSSFILTVFLLLFIGATMTQSQQFTEQTTVMLDGVSDGSIAWGDYNNDGYLDILLSGNTGSPDSGTTKIFKNNGDGTFTELVSASLQGLNNSSLAWGDYNNDGLLDILLIGEIEYQDQRSLVYKNNGDGTFTSQPTPFPPVSSGSVSWGDYDNDGDLDILFMGSRSLGINNILETSVYENDGNGNFFYQASVDLPGSRFGAWGDYNNDGYLDILLTGGQVHLGGSSGVYKNNRNKTFTEQSSITLADLIYGSGAWGDYNNDGFLDILLTGQSSSGPVTKIYKNDGNGSFEEQTQISLVNLNSSSAAWGDYNNDGFLDFLIIGNSDSGLVSKIYENDGNGNFIELNMANITGVSGGSVAWGDYDNDGDLDFVLTGFDGTNPITKLYQNNNSDLNTVPAAPVNLSSLVNGNSVDLDWDKASDAQTPQNGLSYNIVIGTTPESLNTLSPMSDRTTGFRRVVRLGNSQPNFKTINDLPAGQYYWSVQTIDGAFAGSEFSSENSFEITIPLPEFVESTNISFAAEEGKWGDYDNDGDLDLLLVSATMCKLYENKGSGIFEPIDSTFTGGDFRSAEWGDYNNDGFLDILLINSSKIYKNMGDGSFEEVLLPLGSVGNGKATWGDYDNDGDLDFAFTGFISSTPITKIYNNLGNDTFVQADSLLGMGYGTPAWGDYDNDGDLDILVTGFVSEGGDPIGRSAVYKNNGDNTFSLQMSILLDGVGYSDCEWADFDNDGHLDIILSGATRAFSVWNYPHISQIYKNRGDGTFELFLTPMMGVWDSQIAYGDYDNDGYADIFLTGTYTRHILSGNHISESTSKIYRNMGDEGLIEAFTVPAGSGAWGDYDNDGDLDLIIAGSVSKIFRNDNTLPNSIPSTPSNLNANINYNEVTLSWDKSVDNETSQDGLHYNIVIGTSPNGIDILSPMADRTTGFRKVVRKGNSQTNSWTIKNLPAGTYYWSVQAIDGSFAGSQFADEETFDMPIPVELTSFNVSPVENGFVLNWSTATEINNKGFEIERKSGEQEWAQIAFVEGEGTTTEETKYSYKDKYLSTSGKYQYRLKQIDFDGSFEYSQTVEVSLDPVISYELLQNYPNPFNPATQIRYAIPERTKVSLKIYDILGNEIISLVNEIKEPGYYNVDFNAGKLSGGVYVFRLITDNFSSSKKMMLLK